MPKKTQRPIDVKDTLRSVIGKDALDAAAEKLWNTLMCDPDIAYGASPYHLQSSHVQTAAQASVIAVLGSAVPALLRQRAAEYEGETRGCLRELADDIEQEHG